MLPSSPGELAIPADAPAPRRVPALTAIDVTLLYAVAYLVWERNDWGSPTIQNLVSNVAFMPLNLAEILGFSEPIKAVPIVEPDARHLVGLVAAEREPHTPLVSALLHEARSLAAAMGPIDR